MNAYTLFTQVLAQLAAFAAALVLAPLLTGWINQCRAWLQNRSAPPLLQTYYTLHKLFHKDVLLAHNASPLFRAAPYIIFGCLALAASIVPTLSIWSASLPWRGCSSPSPGWTSAPRSARSARGARC